MAKSENLSQESLRDLIEERGLRVLAGFRKEASSGVSDPKLLEVISFVSDYWKDHFRPAFAGLCCEAVGGRIEDADDVSLMITLTAAGGGVHDDIIDKSSNKHFRATVFGKYGIDYALLVGDLLIQKGWTLARNIVEKAQSNKLAEIIDIFGHWTLDVCEAEFMEIQCRRNLYTEIGHYESILFKSMADTRACAKLGALVGGGSESEIGILTEFGSSLGFMYRLTDDLKDTLNVEYNLPARLRNESVPLPILFAARACEEKIPVLESIISQQSPETFDLKQVLDICIEEKAFEYLYKRAKETARETLKDLCGLKNSIQKHTLVSMIMGSLAEISDLTKQAASDYQQGLYS